MEHLVSRVVPGLNAVTRGRRKGRREEEGTETLLRFFERGDRGPESVRPSLGPHLSPSTTRKVPQRLSPTGRPRCLFSPPVLSETIL